MDSTDITTTSKQSKNYPVSTTLHLTCPESLTLMTARVSGRPY